MDIVIDIKKTVYEAMFNDIRVFDIADCCETGWHFNAIKNYLKKVRKRDQVYFCCENKILGYSLISSIKRINLDEQSRSRGLLIGYMNGQQIRWVYPYWYKEPIDYKKKLKPKHGKYINLKKVLQGKPVPELIPGQKKVILTLKREGTEWI